MTTQEAAAKCRQWAVRAKKDMKQYDGDEHSYHYHDGLDYAYMAAANLIEQIGVPQPWPPPEEMERYGVTILGWMPRTKEWIELNWDGKRFVDYEYCTNTCSHWLPMPPAPEVKG